ncbi:MAG: hypothetical protein GX267_01855 [Fibrobacter sp.]|jgi:hypothetical protein|nr:hypothetical protein [Fibrobacter sp.]
MNSPVSEGYCPLFALELKGKLSTLNGNYSIIKPDGSNAISGLIKLKPESDDSLK